MNTHIQNLYVHISDYLSSCLMSESLHAGSVQKKKLKMMLMTTNDTRMTLRQSICYAYMCVWV